MSPIVREIFDRLPELDALCGYTRIKAVEDYLANAELVPLFAITSP